MKRTRRTKLSITVESALYEAIAGHAQQTGVAKSRLVDDALRLWQKRRLALLARKGYQRMAQENEEDAKAYVPVQVELEEE